MPDNLKRDVLIVGAGNMAAEYLKVLQYLNHNYVVVGRGSENAASFEKKTGVKPVTGGIAAFLQETKNIPQYAIVATGVDVLKENCESLVKAGVKYILLEKPGAASYDEFSRLADFARQAESKIFLAYNRRFYSSVRKLLTLAEKDGGIISFNFEFTEWTNQIEALSFSNEIKRNWFLANSSHVVDLAFFIGGFPVRLSAFVRGELPWHKNTIFAGAGTTEKGALFNYSANWESAGRWGVEALTEKHRFYLRPMEKLFVQKRYELAVTEVTLDDNYDLDFKPGLLLQTQYFLDNQTENFADLEYQVDMIDKVYKIINPQE